MAIIEAAALPSTEGEQWNMQSDTGRFALTEIHRLIPNFHLRIVEPMSFTLTERVTHAAPICQDDKQVSYAIEPFCTALKGVPNPSSLEMKGPYDPLCFCPKERQPFGMASKAGYRCQAAMLLASCSLVTRRIAKNASGCFSLRPAGVGERQESDFPCAI